MSSLIAFDEIISKSSQSSKSSFTILVLHGLLGCGNDLAEFCHSLMSSLSTSYASSDWRMVLVDLRNHGNSVDKEGLSPPHDMVNTAKDLANLVKSLGWAWPDVVIGHSLGGKVALQYALSCVQGDYGDSAQIPKQVWDLDVSPGKFETNISPGTSETNSVYEEFVKALHTLQTITSPIPSQKWLLDHLMNLGFSKSISEWISSSLKKSGEHMTIPFNIDGAIEMFKSALEMDYWSFVEHLPKGMEIAIVHTENWDQSVVDRLESLAKCEVDELTTGKVSVDVVPNSGHWIYRDQPQALLDIMIPKMGSMVEPKL